MDVTETWQYTASHTVTQAELDAGADIVNTATVTGDRGDRGHRRRLGAGCAEQDPAHREGRLGSGRHGGRGRRDINYTLAVTNTGNAAIAGVVVGDPFTTNEAPVLNGAFNVGDTDQDNLLDVTETWQYTASHR